MMRLTSQIPLQRAFAVLAWERAAPAFLPALVVAACLFALLWTGTYALLTPVWHVTALIISVLILIGTLMMGASRFRYPERREALRRIEERNDLPSGLLDGVFAQPFGGDPDNPLWIASQQRLAQLVGRPKEPRSTLDWRAIDPLALRFVTMGVVLLAILSTQGSQEGLRASLLPQGRMDDPVVIDAWLEPPAYTGLSSQIIKGTHPALFRAAPEDSELHVRLRREDGRPVRGVVTFAEDGATRRRRIRTAGSAEGTARLILTQSGSLSVTAGGQTAVYNFRTRPDGPPSLKLLGEPDTSTGAISLEVETIDDYPLAEGRMILSLIPGQKLSADAPMPDTRVIEAPEVIELPGLTGPPGVRRLEVDAVEHPWAGLLVKAMFEVVDGRGQTARSEAIAFTMPERTFYNPLSKSVIAERQKLAMAPSHLNKSAQLFQALTHAPDLFDVEPSDHLMLRATAQAVSAAKQRDVPDLVAGLWPLAIELEDDGLAFAKAQLDAAEQKLREALREGAGPDVLRERIAELRDAMNAYLRALAESGLARTDDGDSGRRRLAQTDLEDMLQRMQDLADQGARQQAEELLRQLEAMLQSLRLAEGGEGEGQENGGQQGMAGSGGQGGSGSAGEQALSGTGDLMQRQRELSDQTFSARRGDRPGRGLGEQQENLAEDLEALRNGYGQGGEAVGEAFDRAEEAMRAAARALDQGQLSSAQRLQEQALSALREGGRELAEMLDAETEGSGDSPFGGTDPFGRAWGGEDGPNPEDFGLYDPERIRALIIDIRRRLEDPQLSSAERRYLESLLERF